MKKMNFSFLGLKAKMVLPLFLLVGLFMISATSVSAQYVSSDKAIEILDKHLSKLPARTASLRRSGQDMNDKMIEESTNSLRHRFTQSIIFKISDGLPVSDAINKTYAIALDRVHKETLDKVKQEYVDLLTD